MSISNHQINFTTNLGPLEAALAGLGSSAENLLGRVRAAATQPINIPANITLAPGVGQNVAAGIGNVSSTAFGISREAFTSEGVLGSSGAGAIAQREMARALADARALVQGLTVRDLQAPDGGRPRGADGRFLGQEAKRELLLQTQTQLLAQINAVEARYLTTRFEAVGIQKAVIAAAQFRIAADNAETQTTLASTLAGRKKLAAITANTEAGLLNAVGTVAEAEAKRKHLLAINSSVQAEFANTQGTLAEAAARQKRIAAINKNIQSEFASEQTSFAERTAMQRQIAAINANIRAQFNNTQATFEAAAAQRRAAVAASAAAGRQQLAAGGGGFGGGFGSAVGRAGGLGGLFGGGLASTLRFAVPSALLFGAVTSVSKLVKEAEELEQIFVRLDSQFESLGARGLFGGTSPTEQAENAASELAKYKEELFSIAAATGVANDETVELGQRFIGLFSSLEGSSDVRELSEQATRLTTEFQVITGLGFAETFNDLTGATRSYAETGDELLVLFDDITDAVVNVSDATGVASGEIIDFVGRLGPAAAQAQLSLDETIALGATALQGSGVGGAALAEQFGRILTGLSGELGVELSRLAQDFEGVFSQIDVDGSPLSELFSVENIAEGNVDRVLIGLINGFDELSQAQQRQIVASIGSRREGATLAAVLQNAATFTNALDAATNGAGQRQERFAVIIERLTGQWGRLRVQMTQLGQDLFQSGLGDFLAGLIDGLGDALTAFGLLAAGILPIIEFFDKIFPGSLASTIGQLLTLTLVFKGLSAVFRLGIFDRVAFGMFNLAGVADRATAAVSGTSSAMGVAATQTRGLAGGLVSLRAGIAGVAASIGPMGLALGVAFVAWNAINGAMEENRREAEASADRQRLVGEAMNASNDSFAQAANAARAYVAALEEVSNAEGNVGDAGGNALANRTRENLRGLDESGDSGRTLQSGLNASGQTLDQALDDLLKDEEDKILRVREQLSFIDSITDESLANRAVDFFTRADSFEDFTEDEIRKEFERLTEDNETPAVLRGLIEGYLSGEQGLDPTLNAIKVLTDSVVGERERRLASEQEVQDGLRSALDAGDERVAGLNETRIQALIQEAADAGAENPAGQVYEDLGFISEAAAEAQIEVVRENFDLAKQRFEAGQITQEEFFRVIDAEKASLQGILEPQVNADTPGSQATAADVAAALAEAEQLQADVVRQRFDELVETQDLIGRPLEGDDLVQELRALAGDARIQSNQANFRAVVGDLIAAERDAVEAALDKAETVAEVQEIANTPLSAETSRLFTLQQVSSNEAILEVARVLGISSANLPDFFGDIADAIEKGASFKQAVAAKLRAELEVLLAAIGSGGGPETGLGDRASEIRAALDALEVEGVSGDDVDLVAPAELEARLAKVSKSVQEKVIQELDNQRALAEAFGGEASLAAEVNALVAALNNPDLTAGSQEAQELSYELADTIRAILELEGAEAQAMTEAVLAVSDTAGLGLEGLGRAQVIYQAIASATNGFNQFLAQYVTSGTGLFNSMLQQISVYIAGGLSAIEAVKRVAREAVASLKAQVAQLASQVNADPLAILATQDQLVGAEAFAGAEAEFNAAIASIPTPSFTPASSSGSSDGGSTSGKTAGEKWREALIDLQEARFALLRAEAGDDPVKQALIAGQEADFEYGIAKTEADRIRAAAARVEAKREFWSAVNDVLQAQNELAIAVAESIGDTEGVLALTVEGARAQLEFLQNSGAGLAEIYAAEANLIRAEQAEEEGLVRADLDELSFLYSIGELTRGAYIASLKEILAQVDQVTDYELWRQITKQIYDLENSANGLSTNLPDTFTLPTLFEVRRLDQAQGLSPSGAPGGSIPFSTVTTTNNTFTINVQTGMDWEEAREIIGEALGADSSVFALNTRRY